MFWKYIKIIIKVKEIKFLRRRTNDFLPCQFYKTIFLNQQDFFPNKTFVVNFSASYVSKALLFVSASAYYLYSSVGKDTPVYQTWQKPGAALQTSLLLNGWKELSQQVLQNQVSLNVHSKAGVFWIYYNGNIFLSKCQTICKNWYNLLDFHDNILCVNWNTTHIQWHFLYWVTRFLLLFVNTNMLST